MAMDSRCPCTKECTGRSATCRLSCDAFKQYDAMKREEYVTKYKQRKTDQTLTGVLYRRFNKRTQKC